MALPLVEILNGGSVDTYKTTDLDRESRKYMHLRLNNVIKSYDSDGVLTKINKYYPIRRC